jgi:glycosyltransferase involved in cell wall biosynthesis
VSAAGRQPLVSVIVPTLNAGRYLADALDSVAAQTYSNWEVVLVDGGSTDGTLELAGRYAGVRIVPQGGTGLTGAWNQGLEAARGELIAFLDSDDRWEPAKLGLQVALLDADPALECATTRFRFVLEPGFGVPPGFRPEALETDHFGNVPSALLVRRSLFDRIGAFDTRWDIAADVDWFARVKDAGVRIEAVPKVLVHKRVHDRNLSIVGGSVTLNRELVAVLRESVQRQRQEPRDD